MIAASLNPVYEAAAQSHDLAWMGVVSTLMFCAAFAAWVFIAMRPANRERWEAAGRMPLEDDDPEGVEP